MGLVTLHMDGCVTPGSPFTYAGTFTIATRVGNLAGNVAGPIYNVLPSPLLPYDFELTLTVISGTGAFTGTTGAIHVSMHWPPPYEAQLTGVGQHPAGPRLTLSGPGRLINSAVGLQLAGLNPAEAPPWLWAERRNEVAGLGHLVHGVDGNPGA